MSAKAELSFQKHNPALIGLVTGLVIRAAWQVGLIPSVAQMLRDAGICIWITLNDLFSAGWAFWQFVIR